MKGKSIERQGDVVIIKLNKEMQTIPPELNPERATQFVTKGETGKEHCFTGVKKVGLADKIPPDILRRITTERGVPLSQVLVQGIKGLTIIQISKKGKVIHPDHPEKMLTSGFYAVVRGREYMSEKQQTKNVVD